MRSIAACDIVIAGYSSCLMVFAASTKPIFAQCGQNSEVEFVASTTPSMLSVCQTQKSVRSQYVAFPCSEWFELEEHSQPVRGSSLLSVV